MIIQSIISVITAKLEIRLAAKRNVVSILFKHTGRPRLAGEAELRLRHVETADAVRRHGSRDLVRDSLVTLANVEGLQPALIVTGRLQSLRRIGDDGVDEVGEG